MLPPPPYVIIFNRWRDGKEAWRAARPNYKCNCMTMTATVYYVDWHAAAAATETTAILTARGTQRIDFICSVTVHIWYLWT